MKRPPDRKLLLAAMTVIMAAAVAFARPAAGVHIGVQPSGEAVMSIFKPFSGGR